VNCWRRLRREQRKANCAVLSKMKRAYFNLDPIARPVTTTLKMMLATDRYDGIEVIPKPLAFSA
jgi:hypothetical protein